MLVALLTSTLLGSQAWACTVGLVTPAGRELVSDNPVFSWDTDCVVSRIGFSRPGASTWQWRSWGTVSSLTHPDPAWDRLSEGPWVHGVRWKVQGRDADGGMAASSTHFLNVNVPPESPSIEVVPSDPVAGAHDLVCEIARSSTDADGDAVSYHFHWVVDGGSYPRSSDTGPDTTTWTDDTIPTEDLSLGETWVCFAVPDDGTATGDTGIATASVTAEALPDFSLDDENSTSATHGHSVSPRDYLEQVSGWYFGHAT